MSGRADIVVLRAGDDCGEAARLLKAFFSEEGFSTPDGRIEENLRCMLELDICRVLVVREGSAAVAVATLSLDFGIEFGWAAEIGDLYVVSAARGRGLARALVEACGDLARQQGATNLYVTVTAHGEDAGLDRFYARLGFDCEGRRILSRAIAG
jgi:GNAT superfamily N-acetyltransferase